MLAPAIATAQQAAPPPAAADDAALKHRADDLVALLNGGGDVAAAFAPEFLAQVNEAQLRATIAQVTQMLGRAETVATLTPISAHAADATIAYEKGSLSLKFAVQPEAPHRFVGLRLTGTQSGEQSIAEVAAAVRALPGKTGFILTRLDAPDASPIAAIDPDRPLAIGSAFKLVILAELVRAIEAGERDWDEAITLDGSDLPGGFYADKAKGTIATLRDLATRMISVSDNSATDILLATLGRAKVEAMLPVIGVKDPAGMRPFLSTLEMFKLKGVDGGKLGDQWLTLDEKGRRTLLADKVGPAPISAIPAGLFQDNKPNRLGIEWYASPADLARMMDWLRRHTDSGPAAEARRILGLNPGIPPDAASAWRYVGYKGGSEPGVLDMTLLLEAKAGGWYVLSGTWNNPDAALAEGRLIGLIARAATLAAAP
ncbi:serine hydrolase [Hephaestia sp. GCM10023244]|uniref:serine hydrolase n=1 Tax=unclassified Hephaestia TaxID=2631281 RepID=UPI00207774CF|nr:serine hydrolase [Hephaestia sp. MAHUQ-44]MCM8729482.1 class A beta-lactamase-related serine hydrolase [Hephaestia sp. MAHUQ-44]